MSSNGKQRASGATPLLACRPRSRVGFPSETCAHPENASGSLHHLLAPLRRIRFYGMHAFRGTIHPRAIDFLRRSHPSAESEQHAFRSPPCPFFHHSGSAQMCTEGTREDCGTICTLTIAYQQRPETASRKGHAHAFIRDGGRIGFCSRDGSCNPSVCVRISLDRVHYNCTATRFTLSHVCNA